MERVFVTKRVLFEGWDRNYVKTDIIKVKDIELNALKERAYEFFIDNVTKNYKAPQPRFAMRAEGRIKIK